MAIRDSVDMIAGIPQEEYMAMLDDPAAMAECAAQQCPEGYTIGLELGAMVARASGLLEKSDFDKKAWGDQHNEVEARAWKLTNEKATEKDSAAWEWAIHAITYGMRDGLRQPMQKFEVEGVPG